MADLPRFHFIGICGTAMGAVAAAMKQRGHVVTGSDAKVYPPMSDFLRDQGITIAEHAFEDHRDNPVPQLSVDRQIFIPLRIHYSSVKKCADQTGRR